MDTMLFEGVTGFEWDEQKNITNYNKHKVSFDEASEAFFDLKYKLSKIERDTLEEDRFFLIGKMDSGILITIIFTIREKNIRIISARHPKKRELLLYQN